MIHPIKPLSQLTPMLKGFSKTKGLTQAATAEKLGLTQRSHAYFEGKMLPNDFPMDMAQAVFGGMRKLSAKLAASSS